MKAPIKNYGYKNRGMWLENLINDSNSYYEYIDKALIYKKPTPIKILKVSYPDRSHTVINKAVFSSISTLDYNGIYKGRYIEFDAKETQSKTSFPLSNIHVHQLNHIKKIIYFGGIAFLIVRFVKLDETFILMGSDLINFINTHDRKSIPYSYFKEVGYVLELKYNPRLDYIKVIDYIIRDKDVGNYES